MWKNLETLRRTTWRWWKHSASLLMCVACVALLIADSSDGEAPNDGGYNRGEQSSGNREGGSRIWLGHIAVHPSGRYFFSRVKDDLVLGSVATGKVEVLEGMENIERLVFDTHNKAMLYATQTNSSFTEVNLLAYDLDERKILWKVELNGLFNLDSLRLDHDPTTDGLVLTEPNRIRMFAAVSGVVRWDHRSIGGSLVDVDLVPAIGKVVLTQSEVWVRTRPETTAEPSRQAAGNRLQEAPVQQGVLRHITAAEAQTNRTDDRAMQLANTNADPNLIVAQRMNRRPVTTLWFISYRTGQRSHTNIPNCGGEMVISSDGSRGFLAPTRCIPPPEPEKPEEGTSKSNGSPGSNNNSGNNPGSNSTTTPRTRQNAGRNYDPVSVIDLRKEKWVRNLPGFGPVALSKDGTMAVAFMDRKSLDVSLFGEYGEMPELEGTNYLLMFIDPRTLKFKSMDLGDTLPRYSVTPNGQHLLIDNSATFSGPESIRILDIQTQKLREVDGPNLHMDHFVLMPNSREAYLRGPQSQLYRLDILEGKLLEIPLEFKVQSINKSPLSDILFLKDTEEGDVHLYCTFGRKLCGEVASETGAQVTQTDSLDDNSLYP